MKRPLRFRDVIRRRFQKAARTALETLDPDNLDFLARTVEVSTRNALHPPIKDTRPPLRRRGKAA